MSDDSLLTIEKLIDGNRLAHGRGVAQEELIEIADALSSGELAQCQIALGARGPGLQQSAGSTGCYAEEGEHRECNRDAIATHEFAGAIHQRVGASPDRFTFKIAAKVTREQAHGCIALPRFLL